MKSILIISPWLGVKDRGAETFSKELSELLANTYDVTLVSGGKVPLNYVQEHIITNFKPSIWVEISEKIYFYFVVMSKRKLTGFFFNFIKRVWDRIYYIHPEVLYQKEFMLKLDADLSYRKWDVIFPQNGILGVKWALKQRSRGNALAVIYTGHGGIGNAEALILKTSLDKYIAISKKSYEWAKKINKKTVHIYNGVNVDMFDCVNLAKEKNDVINVVSVGALTSFKRHELTIKALKFIPNGYLTIIGDGELKYELTQFAESVIPGRYKIEKIKYSEMSRIYSEADIFVLPSLNEPMGIVYIEALVSGVKVVAPNDDVRKEILQEFGFYTDVTNAKLYADRIISAYSSEYSAIDAIKYAKSKFSWGYISAEYNEILKELSAKL